MCRRDHRVRCTYVASCFVLSVSVSDLVHACVHPCIHAGRPGSGQVCKYAGAWKCISGHVGMWVANQLTPASLTVKICTSAFVQGMCVDWDGMGWNVS